MTRPTQYCTFLLDSQLFGLPVSAVQEVLRSQEVTRVPLAAPEVSGLVNLRGQIVIALDLRTRLGFAPRRAGASPVNVVVRPVDGGAVSLLVDEIGQVLEPDEESFEPPPATVSPDVREVVTAVCKLDDRLMLLLDPELVTTVGGAA